MDTASLDLAVNGEAYASARSHIPFYLPNKGTAMKVNVGGIDRALRLVVGIALIALAATGVIGWWGWLGVIPLLTGLFSVCPLYSLLGVNTCPLKRGQ